MGIDVFKNKNYYYKILYHRKYAQIGHSDEKRGALFFVLFLFFGIDYNTRISYYTYNGRRVSIYGAIEFLYFNAFQI